MPDDPGAPPRGQPPRGDPARLTPGPWPGVLPRQVKLFGWVSLLNDFASEMIYPLLPAFVTGVLGAGPQAPGALDGAAEFAAAFVKLGAGRLADRVPLRGPMIVLGYFIAVVVRPVIAITGAAWQVIGLRVVDRLGKGLRTPPRDALIADVTPAELRGRAFGLQRGMDHAGAVLGPILAWWLLAPGGGERERAGGDRVEHCARGARTGAGGMGGEGRGGNRRQRAATSGKCIGANAALCRPLPPFAAAPRRHLRLLSPPDARHPDHPAFAGAGCAGVDRAALVGGGARGALVVEFPRGRGERPAGARADDVGGVARVRDAGRGDGARGHGGGGMGAVPGAGARRGTDGESRAGPRGAARGHAPGERVRPVSWHHRVRSSRGRRGTGRSVPALRGGPRVPRECDGGIGTRVRVASIRRGLASRSARVEPRTRCV